MGHRDLAWGRRHGPMAGRQSGASIARSKAVYSAIDSHALAGSQNKNGFCELNGPPNRCLRAENRPEHFSRARGRSAVSPTTHPDFGFAARADSADETCVLVAF